MRLFVALVLGEDFKRDLLEASRPLREVRTELRWERADKLHLTLAFLGEAEADAAELVAAAAERAAADAAPFELSASALRLLPRRAPHTVLAAAADAGAAESAALAARFEAELSALGRAAGTATRAPERRPFAAHVTLARSGRGGFVLGPEERRLAFPVRGAVDSLAVFESVLAPGGSRYAVRESFRLSGSELGCGSPSARRAGPKTKRR